MRPIKIIILISITFLFYPFNQVKYQTQKRAMTFLDIIQMRSLGDADISPDGKWIRCKEGWIDWKGMIETLDK